MVSRFQTEEGEVMAKFTGYLVRDLHVGAPWVVCPRCGDRHLCLSVGHTCATCLLGSQVAILRLIAALSPSVLAARGGTFVCRSKIGSA